jgi:hypothetical protein
MAKIKLRRDTEANWNSIDPVLASGEPGYETDTGKLKIGNGSDIWSELPYFDDQEMILSAVTQNIVPNEDNAYDLGAPDKQWRDIYVSEGSIYIGDVKLSNQDGQLVVQQVTDPGQETEAPVPDTPGSVTTDRLVNGENSLVLNSNGTVDLNGEPFTGGGNADTGDITFDATTISAANGVDIIIEAKDEDGVANTSIKLDPEYAAVKLSAKLLDSRQFYEGESQDYATGTWTTTNGSATLSLDGATRFLDFTNDDAEWRQAGDRETGEFSLDGVTWYQWPYSSSSSGPGQISVTFSDPSFTANDPVGVETFYLRWTNESYITVDQDDYSEVKIVGAGVGVKIISTGSINSEAGDSFNFEAQRSISLETIDEDVRIRTNIYGSQKSWEFKTDGTLKMPDAGELAFYSSGIGTGKIVPSTSTGGGLQVEAQSDFEIKVTQGEGEEEETAIWSFEPNGELNFPDGTTQTTAYTGEGNGGGSSTTELAYLELTNKAFGEPVEFTNTGEDGGVDEISEGLHITRGEVGWLYNPLVDEESGENTPTNSLWNNDGWNDLTDIEDREYVSLATIWQYNFRNIVGAEMVMLDTTTDKYYAVKITRWSRDGAGFSYVRYELDLTQLQEGITFADGTVQKTAYVATNVKLTAEGNRRIEEVAGYKSVSVTSQTVDQEFTGVTLAPNLALPWDVFIDGTVYTELYDYVSEFPNEPMTLSINDAEYTVQPYISGDNIVLYAFDPNSGGVPVSYSEGDTFTVTKFVGGEPVVWWDKRELPGGSSNFRGAIIDYHAYAGNGTIIGTIHIVDDSGENHITHTEVSSGSSSSLEADDLWVVDDEGTISYRRLDGQESTLRIQWTAKVFYSSEYYD